MHRLGQRPQLLVGPRFGGTNQQAFFKRVGQEGACRMEHFEFGKGERLTSVEVYTRTHGRKLWYEIGPPLLTRLLS